MFRLKYKKKTIFLPNDDAQQKIGGNLEADDDITEEIFSFWENAISATENMRWDGLLELVEDQSRISKVCCLELLTNI